MSSKLSTGVHNQLRPRDIPSSRETEERLKWKGTAEKIQFELFLEHIKRHNAERCNWQIRVRKLMKNRQAEFHRAEALWQNDQFVIWDVIYLQGNQVWWRKMSMLSECDWAVMSEEKEKWETGVKLFVFVRNGFILGPHTYFKSITWG